MKKILLTTVTCLSLSACVGFGKTETEILKAAAINDARQAGTKLHLAFLQCYALKDVDKKSCQTAAGNTNQRYADAVNWEYIRPFRYEAERLGFKAFLNNKNKACQTLNEGPQFNTETKNYAVNCAKGKTYHMRFDYKKGQWHLVD